MIFFNRMFFVFMYIFVGFKVFGTNIVFEGVNACGKTTVIAELKSLLKEKGKDYCIVNELKGSPVQNLLSFQDKSFRLVEDERYFYASVYESLLLSAHNYFKQGRYGKRQNDIVNVFDRDFMTVLTYQKIILQDEIGKEYTKFFNPFKEIVLFDLMPIKAIVYLSVPVEVSVARALNRGKEQPYTDKELDFLRKAKNYYETELIPEMKERNINVLELDGTQDPRVNAYKIYNLIFEEVKE